MVFAFYFKYAEYAKNVLCGEYMINLRYQRKTALKMMPTQVRDRNKSDLALVVLMLS